MFFRRFCCIFHEKTMKTKEKTNKNHAKCERNENCWNHSDSASHYVIPTIKVHSGPAPVRQYSCRVYKTPPILLRQVWWHPLMMEKLFTLLRRFSSSEAFFALHDYEVAFPFPSAKRNSLFLHLTDESP